MDQEKESPATSRSSQDSSFRSENVGMEDEEEEETKNVKLYNTEDEDDDGSPQKVPEEATSSSSESPTGATKLKHQHCSRVQERWPISNPEHFAKLRARRRDSEKTVYTLDEDEELSISKTEKVTKDDLPVAATIEKRLSTSFPSPSTVKVPERSLPVSLKLQKRSVSESEVNNNLDDIQPQFKELSLYSPNKTQTKKTGKPNSFGAIKHLRFYVEVTCVANTGQGEILNICCEPLLDTTPPLVTAPEQELDTSGHLGDVSKTISSLSSSPMSYIPPPPSHMTRMSYVSSSSGSSFPGSAAALSSQKSVKNTLKLENLQPARVTYLSKKWKNSNLVYGLLDYVDKMSCEDLSMALQFLVNNKNGEKKPANLDSVPEEVTPLNTRKRHNSPGPSSSIKRMKPSSPIPSTSFDDLLGNEVFAKWQNRKYYFARITAVLDENHFQVVFLDTTVRTVTKDQIVNDLEALIGNKIMVTKEAEGDKYFPGIATGFFVDDGVLKYSVLTDNGDFEAGMSQIYFTEHQAKSIKQIAQTSSRASSTDLSRSSTLYAGCSGVQKDKSDPGSETDTSPNKLHQDVDKHVMGCDIETNDPQNLSPCVKLKSVQGKLPKRSNKNEDILLGPLKSQGTWFKGLNFMITCSTRPVTSATEEVQTDSEDYPFTSVPFVYDRLVQQIKLGGGEVFEKFDDIPPDQYSSTYLVTNRPCLTPKYLQCLAAGITIICHEWVVNSTIKQKRQPLIDLPAGWSLEKNRFINMFDRKTSQPLSGLRIKLAQLTDHNFYKFWSSICNMVGGSASMFTGNFENTNVIVAENGLKDDTLDKAAAYGVALVSATWIMQSVINGEARPYDGHPCYNHLYEEPEDF